MPFYILIAAITLAIAFAILWRLLRQPRGNARQVNPKIAHPSAVPTEAFVPAPESSPSLPETDNPTRHVDENVQFTVWKPRVVQPDHWYPLLGFMHLSEKATDSRDDIDDPVAEMKAQAERILGAQADMYNPNTTESRKAVPRDGEITFIPLVSGVEFNPARHSFTWTESVHRAEFRMRANRVLDGSTARGRVDVYLGTILLADVPVAIRVDIGAPSSPAEVESRTASRYKNIFASYSRKDVEIVKQFEAYAVATGDRYLRDLVDLRAGEEWSPGLEKLILRADVFQLFWSSNSMRSKVVREEYNYALSLNRPEFVRPTYWEHPMPANPAEDLPPPELSKLHFTRWGGAPPASAADDEMHSIFSRDTQPGHIQYHPAPQIAHRDPSPGAAQSPVTTTFADAPAQEAQPATPKLRFEEDLLKPNNELAIRDKSTTAGAPLPQPREVSQARARKIRVHVRPAVLARSIAAVTVLGVVGGLWYRQGISVNDGTVQHGKYASNGIARTRSNAPVTATTRDVDLDKIRGMAKSLSPSIKRALAGMASTLVHTPKEPDAESIKFMVILQVEGAYKQKLTDKEYDEVFGHLYSWADLREVVGQDWLADVYQSAHDAARDRALAIRRREPYLQDRIYSTPLRLNEPNIMAGRGQ